MHRFTLFLFYFAFGCVFLAFFFFIFQSSFFLVFIFFFVSRLPFLTVAVFFFFLLSGITEKKGFFFSYPLLKDNFEMYDIIYLSQYKGNFLFSPFVLKEVRLFVNPLTIYWLTKTESICQSMIVRYTFFYTFFSLTFFFFF